MRLVLAILMTASTALASDFTFFGEGVVVSTNYTLQDGQHSAITLPSTLPQNEIYLAWPKNEYGYGHPVVINKAEAWWITPSLLSAGESFSVYGRNLSLGGSTDALNQIGGHEASIELDKSFQYGILRVSPSAAANWMSEEMTENDFGVPEDKATAERSAYYPGASVSLEAGVGLFIEITTDWLVVGSVAVEWFDENVYDSPIVSEHYVFKGFGAINYVF